MTERDKVERAPERFTPVVDEEGFVYCQRHPYGAFVRLDAYDALQAERDALREALKRSAAALSLVTDPDAIKATTSAIAFAECFAAATIARAALHQTERDG